MFVYEDPFLVGFDSFHYLRTLYKSIFQLSIFNNFFSVFSYYREKCKTSKKNFYCMKGSCKHTVYHNKKQVSKACLCFLSLYCFYIEILR